MAYEPFVLPYKGQEFSIPAGERLRAIGEVEEHLTAEALAKMLGAREYQARKLSEAACAALRVAGAKVKVDDFFEHLNRENGAHRGIEAYQWTYLLLALLALLEPPEGLLKLSAGKAEAAGEGAAPSPGSTSSSSASAG